MKDVLCSNIFVLISNEAVPKQIPRKTDHPELGRGIRTFDKPIHTNKFYANSFLGNQTSTIWTHPYSLAWSRGAGNAASWGVSVSHIERNRMVLGPPESHQPRFYINPIGIQFIIFSAAELGHKTSFTVSEHSAFSANLNIAISSEAAPILTLPVVQGMGFVTGLYKDCTPLFQSSVMFQSVNELEPVESSFKFKFILEDSSIWLLYVTLTGGVTEKPEFELISNMKFLAKSKMTGIFQVAKIGKHDDYERIYDESVGVYGVSAEISASVADSTAEYTLKWIKAGLTDKKLLQFALPHHVESFTDATAKSVTKLQMQTTTKGIGTAVQADSWTMIEKDLPVKMDFNPWSVDQKSISFVSTESSAHIISAAEIEIKDWIVQEYEASMYFSGKALARYAMILYAVGEIANNRELALRYLERLKEAFARYVNNQQATPLVYDERWKGIVSKSGWENAGADFGNTYYNDHHFHYGYFVYTAAIITHFDPLWLSQGTNKAWVNLLVKDFANPIEGNDFPFFRSFDWFHGHSWAKGLFESGDSKDQESTSEDAMASYAVKMWGRATRDINMEARGNLMLAIQRRSFRNYFLMENSNKNQPPEMIANKVAGILFENKIDHTTYFGAEIYKIQGIHMLPLAPPSSYVRSKTFIKEEWENFFANGGDEVRENEQGWKAVLRGNQAFIDPKAAWNFFLNPELVAVRAKIDNGASVTWYRAYIAAIGGL